MQDEEIVHRISELVEREHEMRNTLVEGDGADDDARGRLQELEVQLDQCWDLLRQRRARRQYDDDPDRAEVRDPDTVEHYRQ